MSENTSDANEDFYPYNFSSDAIGGAIIFEKKINPSFNAGIELMQLSRLKHHYTGPISIYDPQPGIDFPKIGPYPANITAIANQNIKSNIILLNSKFKKHLNIFSIDSNIYIKSGVGIAFNHMQDYVRDLAKVITITYPKHTQSNLALNLGIGVEKQIKNITFSFGYDLYSIGSFRTKNQIIIQSRLTKKTETRDIMGKRLLPNNLLLHSISFGLGVNF